MVFHVLHVNAKSRPWQCMHLPTDPTRQCVRCLKRELKRGDGGGDPETHRR